MALITALLPVLFCVVLWPAVCTQDWEPALPPPASLPPPPPPPLAPVPGGQLVSPLPPSPPLQDPRGAPTPLRNPTPFSTHNPSLSGAGSYGVDKMVLGASKNQIAMGSRDHLPNPIL